MGNFISPERLARVKSQFNNSSKQGLIRALILIVIGIVVISVLGFDIRAAIEDPQTQANFSYITKIVRELWETYFAQIWKEISEVVRPILDLVWNNFKNFDVESGSRGLEDFVKQKPASPLTE